jgi:CubicO group peptidase (beta-lactamase class C family)
MKKRTLYAFVFVLAVLFAFAQRDSFVASAQTTKVPESAVDAVFSKYTNSTPGCTVGVALDGQPVLQKGYGMADLEHDVPIKPDSIFEAGSISKQFTAAAVLMLAKAGKLSLDDPVRKYIPELPDYGKPLLIRHMLTHTSGLRDWSSVESIIGWPRTSRVYTHDHVLDIVSHQLHLNFDPGTNWSYSNTGYNLAAILVSRVSGEPFATFEQKNIFAPLGMTHTSWRDDFTRIVKGRTIAYSETRGEFHMDMPFENIHGNGGLLTTVGDLLKWNEYFVEPKIGGTDLVQQQQTPNKYNDGRTHDYGLGLYIGQYKGVREVSHSGSTAGYKAFLTRFPDQYVSVAVLCNVSTSQPTQYAHQVADLYLGSALKPMSTPRVTLTDAELSARADLYRDMATGEPLTIVLDRNQLRVNNAVLLAVSSSEFRLGNRIFRVMTDGRIKVDDGVERSRTYERVQTAKPTAQQLSEYVGAFTSDEAEATLKVAIKGDGLEILRRPNTTFPLTPIYKDGFNAPGLGFIVFHRDARGTVTDFSVVQDRVWDLRFRR